MTSVLSCLHWSTWGRVAQFQCALSGWWLSLSLSWPHPCITPNFIMQSFTDPLSGNPSASSYSKTSAWSTIVAIHSSQILDLFLPTNHVFTCQAAWFWSPWSPQSYHQCLCQCSSWPFWFCPCKTWLEYSLISVIQSYGCCLYSLTPLKPSNLWWTISLDFSFPLAHDC